MNYKKVIAAWSLLFMAATATIWFGLSHQAKPSHKFVLPSGIIVYNIVGTEPAEVCGGIVPFDDTKREYDVIVDDGKSTYTPFKTLKEAVKYTEKYCRPIDTTYVTKEELEDQYNKL